jgi:dTDP-4-dehydrorhamnose 3,5-epimerase
LIKKLKSWEDLGMAETGVETFAIEGLFLFSPKVFADERGHFLECFNQKRLEALGIAFDAKQCNQSFSRRGVLRGLHYQVKRPQAKLVQVLQGEVYDVAVDIRPGSPSFGRWQGVRLVASQPQLFLLPAGFAHGFQVLSETALFQYFCSDFYSPADERGIAWNDPQLAIPWPLAEPVVSSKDAILPLLKDLPSHERRTP